MAQAKKKPAAEAQVASCGATDCKHNESKACTADEIKVTMKGGAPTCGTYAPEKPKARP